MQNKSGSASTAIRGEKFVAAGRVCGGRSWAGSGDERKRVYVLALLSIKSLHLVKEEFFLNSILKEGKNAIFVFKKSVIKMFFDPRSSNWQTFWTYDITLKLYLRTTCSTMTRGRRQSTMANGSAVTKTCQ